MGLLKLNKELSDIPSELLTQALEDLKLCEQNPNVKINMNDWYERDNNICYVCLVGSIMYNNIDSPHLYNSLSIYNFNEYDVKKFKALEKFRTGYVKCGLDCLNKRNYGVQDRDTTSYYINKNKFYKDMYRLVEDLKKVGL